MLQSCRICLKWTLLSNRPGRRPQVRKRQKRSILRAIFIVPANVRRRNSGREKQEVRVEALSGSTGQAGD